MELALAILAAPVRLPRASLKLKTGEFAAFKDAYQSVKLPSDLHVWMKVVQESADKIKENLT